MAEPLKAPFVYMGGKSRIAHAVWQRLGRVSGFVEPFCGSCAVLLANPNYPSCIETVNDKDGLLINTLRSIKYDPEKTTYYADHFISECDLHARHIYLVNLKPDLVPKLEGDPEFYDPKAAGYWLYGINAWIGGGWCSGEGPWQVVDGKLVDAGQLGGVRRQRPHLGDAGRGIYRRLPHLIGGRGIHRQLPHLGDAGRGIHKLTSGLRQQEFILGWLQDLSERLRAVRICCGDWTRVLGPTPTVHAAHPCAIFFDPPYSAAADRDPSIYAHEDLSVAHAVREWAYAHGDNPDLKIAVCGYDSEFQDLPPGWFQLRWKTRGGYGIQGNGRGRANARRECIAFSPFCHDPELSLFGAEAEADLFGAEEVTDAD